MQTQLLLGDPVWLLERHEDGDYYRVQGAEGYIGWVRRDALRLMDKAEWEAWNARPAARITRDHMLNDFRLPAGGRLPIVEVGGDTVTVQLPQAVRGANRSDTAAVPREVLLLPAVPPRGELVAAAAREFLTVPYVFGGRSALGLDCSGLVGVSYAAAGLVLPRDAFQQAIVGNVVATPWNIDNMLPGDALFFIDGTGRLIHTGISLGGHEFIHASPPEVHITSLNPEHPAYSPTWREAFTFARRPLDP